MSSELILLWAVSIQVTVDLLRVYVDASSNSNLIMTIEPVVVVTGAAGGIGFEIVRHLLEELNGRVVAVDIIKGELESLAAAHGRRLEVVVGDITDVGSQMPTQ